MNVVVPPEAPAVTALIVAVPPWYVWLRTTFVPGAKVAAFVPLLWKVNDTISGAGSTVIANVCWAWAAVVAAFWIDAVYVHTDVALTVGAVCDDVPVPEASVIANAEIVAAGMQLPTTTALPFAPLVSMLNVKPAPEVVCAVEPENELMIGDGTTDTLTLPGVLAEVTDVPAAFVTVSM